jgi:hypothetical protein
MLDSHRSQTALFSWVGGDRGWSGVRPGKGGAVKLEAPKPCCEQVLCQASEPDAAKQEQPNAVCSSFRYKFQVSLRGLGRGPIGQKVVFDDGLGIDEFTILADRWLVDFSMQVSDVLGSRYG